jgi:hypothetical protein
MLNLIALQFRMQGSQMADPKSKNKCLIVLDRPQRLPLDCSGKSGSALQDQEKLHLIACRAVSI